MPVRDARIEDCLDTIYAIAASPFVETYLVGFTARSCWARLREYRNIEYDHMVLLADKLTRSAALDLEHEIQDRIWHQEDKRAVLHRKYHARRRIGLSYRSFGGIAGRPFDPIHSVYMAWWEP